MGSFLAKFCDHALSATLLPEKQKRKRNAKSYSLRTRHFRAKLRAFPKLPIEYSNANHLHSQTRRFTVKPEDFDALSNQLNNKASEKKFACSFLLIVFLVLVAMILLAGLLGKFYSHRTVTPPRLHTIDTTQDQLYSVLSLFVPMVLFAGFFFLVMKSTKSQRSKIIQTNPDWSQPRIAEITPDHLINRYTSGESLSRWNNIKKVVETDTHIFFLVSDTESHLIPKRAFASQEEAQLFYRTAETYWERARGIEIKAPLPDPRAL